MRQWNNLVYKNSWRWTCKCPKHVEVIYENKIIVKLFASSWYISLLIYMMHGHTYIKFVSNIYLVKVYNLTVIYFFYLVKFESKHFIYDMIWYDMIWYDMICDMMWYIWYDIIYDIMWYIWYDIFVNSNWVDIWWQ